MNLIPKGKDKMNDLIEELWPKIYRFFYYRVQNREEAEELTQEAFHRYYRKQGREAIGEDKLQAYMFTTARNLITDLWRKRGRNPASSSYSQLQEKGWDITYMEENVEEKLLLQEALKELKPDYRRVIIFRILEGRSVQETAEKMKRTPGAVRSLQFRAVQALKQSLERGGFFNDQ